MLEFNEKEFFLDGKPFCLAVGDMHYFRTLPKGWERRLRLMKHFGLNTVQTYVPWNLHEEEEGSFCFDGHLDLSAFLKLCQDLGLYVFLRPSGYICSEWDCGGLPAWLLRDPYMQPRCSYPPFLEALEKYTKRLAKEFVPYLSTNGGPILAVCVENEYGSYGNDRNYLDFLCKLYRDCGVDVPLYSTDGYFFQNMTNGMLDGCFAGANFRIEGEIARKAVKKLRPEYPFFVGEYWSGHAMYWGEPTYRREIPPIVESLDEIYKNGGFLSYYMFCGGTNFGFLNGANESTVSYDAPEGTPRKYLPMMTSYDTDALVGEDGVPTEKYFACREVFLKNSAVPTPAEPLPQAPEFQELGTIQLTEAARVLDQLDCLASHVVKSVAPMSMEALGQNFGFVLYRTQVSDTHNDKPHSLNIRTLRDRATVYENGKYRGTYMRERAYEPVQLLPGKDGVTLDILVENLGRANFDRIIDRKGILGPVTLDDPCRLFGWTQYCLPFKDLSRVEYAPVDSIVIDDETPVLLRGTFDADDTKDAFLHMKGFGKGNVWVNGFNLGRYWEIGPQETLYLPCDLLKKTGNVIEVLDLHHRDRWTTVQGIGHAILFGDPKNAPAYAPENR